MDTRSVPETSLPSQSERSLISAAPGLSEVLQQTLGFVRRQFPIFIFIMACATALGFVYLFTTPARYTAHALLMIDSSKVRVLQQQQAAALADIPIDTSQVETQVELLKSDNIGLSIIK